jgi:hypothetical protein
MFAGAYFGRRYFAEAYWTKGGTIVFYQAPPERTIDIMYSHRVVTIDAVERTIDIMHAHRTVTIDSVDRSVGIPYEHRTIEI